MSNFLDFDFTDSKNIDTFVFDDDVNNLRIYEDDVYYSSATYNTETTSYLTNIETTNYYVYNSTDLEYALEEVNSLLEIIAEGAFWVWFLG